MTMTPDPREDALAKAREAIAKVAAWLDDERWGGWPYMEGSEIYNDKDDAKGWLDIALAAISAPPSQSEPRGCPTPGACSCVQSPTPYVRPAAEIRAEIERVSAKHGSMTARVIALTWTLTPPAQEPR